MQKSELVKHGWEETELLAFRSQSSQVDIFVSGTNYTPTSVLSADCYQEIKIVYTIQHVILD